MFDLSSREDEYYLWYRRGHVATVGSWQAVMETTRNEEATVSGDVEMVLTPSVTGIQALAERRLFAPTCFPSADGRRHALSCAV